MIVRGNNVDLFHFLKKQVRPPHPLSSLESKISADGQIRKKTNGCRPKQFLTKVKKGGAGDECACFQNPIQMIYIFAVDDIGKERVV